LLAFADAYATDLPTGVLDGQQKHHGAHNHEACRFGRRPMSGPVRQGCGRESDRRCDLYNITNQKNWIAEAGAQGNDLITAAMPFHVQGSVTYRF
jgi:hypothetical protein